MAEYGKPSQILAERAKQAKQNSKERDEALLKGLKHLPKVIAAIFVIGVLHNCNKTLEKARNAPPSPFSEIDAKYECRSAIKAQLRDPRSYEFVRAVISSRTGEHNQYGGATITFRARNGFGGMNLGQAICTKSPNGVSALVLSGS